MMKRKEKKRKEKKRKKKKIPQGVDNFMKVWWLTLESGQSTTRVSRLSRVNHLPELATHQPSRVANFGKQKKKKEKKKKTNNFVFFLTQPPILSSPRVSPCWWWRKKENQKKKKKTPELATYTRVSHPSEWLTLGWLTVRFSHPWWWWIQKKWK